MQRSALKIRSASQVVQHNANCMHSNTMNLEANQLHFGFLQRVSKQVFGPGLFKSVVQELCLKIALQL